jgi:hypothetical protein
VLYRRLIFVALLSGCDYLLWNWSLTGSHGLGAIVSGLSLPVLLAMLVWLSIRALARRISTFGARARAQRSQTTLAYRADEASTAVSSITADRTTEREAGSTTGKLAA